MRKPRKSTLYGWVFFILVLLFIFSGFLSGRSVLLTTDSAISHANRSASDIAGMLMSHWNADSLLGTPAGIATQTSNFMQAILPGIMWNNLVYALACLGASFVFCLFFRESICFLALACGALVAFWLGSNFSLLYAGHTFKPYVVLFFACSLVSLTSAGLVCGSVPVALVWGSCVGLMFAQQPDAAMFFALFAGAYLIFRLWQEQGCKPLKWLKVLIPAAVVSLLFAVGPLLSGYKHHVKGTAQVQTQSPQEKWDYMTQWSFPPEETIAFIAPGYTGWRSGEPEGPYWGRMGRSAGWEQTRQGFQNFKLENTYLGVIPIVFALFALFSCRGSKHRNEIIFWSCATLVALLLAFGKFFPLYSLFYKLPVVNNIRNPNKFLQVFQVGLAILTAYGFDALFRSREPTGEVEAES